MAQTRVLTLNKDEFKESVLFRLEKDWVLRFVLGPTLMGHNVRLFTNYPKEPSTPFDRGTWHEMQWTLNSRHKNDDLDKSTEISCEIAGAFGYFFLCDATDESEKSDRCGSGYFQIAPTLHIGAEDVELPLDCIQCQTLLSKCLGPFPEWEARLRVAHESGYNMVHITPVQTLGGSNSSYSLKSHLELDPRYSPQGGGRRFTFDDLKSLTSKMKNEWGVLAISDVVYNHTSYDSPWIMEHPECAYNMQNSPHLRPALLLDRALALFGDQVAAGQWQRRGLPALITEEHHLNAMKAILLDEVLPPQKYHEFFQVNVDSLVNEFKKSIERDHLHSDVKGDKLTILQGPNYRRFESTVDLDLAMKLFCAGGCTDPAVKEKCVNRFKENLVNLNNEATAVCWGHLNEAVNALIGHVRYQRVDHNGPRYQDYTEHHPLFTMYFSDGRVGYQDLAVLEAAIFDPAENKFFWAFNGWVMNDDPLSNFAEPPSMVYFKRSLICWGDCVKLRFGQKPSDCPYLWSYMQEYTKLTCETFYGFRIDNCHSTPIHVAEHMLDYARSVRPDLYICAELFTGHENIDNLFVNKLGITSLVREAQSAGTVFEESRLVFRYGGDPLGAFIQKTTRPMTSSIAHAMFMDLTHDNPPPVQKRTIFDLLPTAALVSAACCSIGSNRGYDEMVPFHVDVVEESRFYTKWSDSPNLVEGEVNLGSGIIAGRRAINELHWEIGAEGYNEIYVDKMTEDVIAVTRHNPKNRQSVIIVANTCFNPQRIGGGRGSFIKPLHISGSIDEIIFEAKLIPGNGAHPEGRPGPKKNDKFILGATGYHLDLKPHQKVFNSNMIEVLMDERNQVVEFKDFPSGSVIALKVSMLPDAKAAIRQLRQHLNEFGYRLRTHSIADVGAGQLFEASSAFGAMLSKMTVQDFNRALFRCHEEEADEGKGGGAFYVPNIGHFVYCGLAGLIPHCTHIRLNNDLGHPLCGNIRDNDWLINYIANRLCLHPGTSEVGNWFKTVIQCYSKLPNYLKPCCLEALISGAYNAMFEGLKQKLSGYVQGGSKFVGLLALGSVVFGGYCRSALLPKLADNVAPPPPPIVADENSGKSEQACTTISAGLPHFAVGLFRNWGRDTFIALPGILLVPGRFDEARYIILACAGCLRHGLVPNLLGSGVAPRYNCRDAVWWWFHAVRRYCEEAPAGAAILNDKVRRLYPTDDAIFGQSEKIEPLHETMQEALTRHFEGIKFRERNAGPQIDEHMRDEGFSMECGVCATTGFVFGGNRFNCGTWMDKMGGSHKAGNRGLPATPRDGSAVELVGLCYETVRWLEKLAKENIYPHKGVKKSGGTQWTWQQWAEKIKQNFERCFWIPANENDVIDAEATDSSKIATRGIYKDSYKASQPWADYQFRPNFCIALTVAPDIVNPEHATIALENASKFLKGPLGMKTLVDTDYNYNGYYNNSDDSSDSRIAQGFNYHNGPEWVWIMGYFLMARLRIASTLNAKKMGSLDTTVNEVKQTLSNHYTHISKSDWKSLPELTNKDGSYCSGSCAAQAWSVGCILEVMYDLSKLE